MRTFLQFLEAKTPADFESVYYHGSSSVLLPSDPSNPPKLLPPSETSKISEKGRKINLNKVFFTTDFNSAKIYAGRAVRQFGGKPVIYRVIPMGDIYTLNGAIGSSVHYSDWAFYVPKNLLEQKSLVFA